ncbi:MAG: hypothetical protein AAB407_00940 [Patescibacteria group bacterium]
METKKEIQWTAPEFHYYHKNFGWYWIVIGSSIVLASVAVFQRNFLFAVFIAIAALLVLAWGMRRPKDIDFTLSEKGIAIGEHHFHPYDNLEGFAIIPAPEDPELAELIFKTKSHIEPWLIVILAEQRKEAVHTFLTDVLPEIEYEDSFIRHIARILRF